MGVAHGDYDSLGKPLRRYVWSKKCTEVVKKLKDLRRKIDDGLLLRDEDVKVTELFERWFDDVMRHQIAPSTFSNYQTVVRMHILPRLRSKRLIELNVIDVDKLLSQKAKCGYLSRGRNFRTTATLAPLAQGVDPGTNGIAREPILERILATPSLYILPDRLKNDSWLLHSFDHFFQHCQAVSSSNDLRVHAEIEDPAQSVLIGVFKFTPPYLQDSGGRALLGAPASVELHMREVVKDPTKRHFDEVNGLSKDVRFSFGDAIVRSLVIRREV
jgi:hypothetical protein